MFKVHRVEGELAGRPLVLETGKIARQADGAVLVTYGKSSLLCTVVASRKVDPAIDFLPLMVLYQEKMFSVGRIPGGFFKRESKPSEVEVLTSRLTDRSLRPLFPKSFRHEVQVVCTVVSADPESDLAVSSIIGASAALSISGIPFQGPVAATRVGYKGGSFLLNPTREQLETSEVNLMVAGTHKGILMVESGATGVHEEVMLEALEKGQQAYEPALKMIGELVKKVNPEPFPTIMVEETSPEVAKKVEALCLSTLQDLARSNSEKPHKATLRSGLEACEAKAKEALAEEGLEEAAYRGAFKKLWKKVVRDRVLGEKRRLDGRGPTDIRSISCEVGLFPRIHGSALFTRGETQAMVSVTLGSKDDSQMVDALFGVYRDAFLFHYNFPPFSVGEVGKMGPPGRREAGHGHLAGRALHAVLPETADFPYVLRIVSDITESNGSSSMASVCGGTLALMDAGVPIKAPVAGIAMGLVTEGKSFTVLSDISGDEDEIGDMDFKVAGTKEGVTALQMDLKIEGVPMDVLKKALGQARDGRLHILQTMLSQGLKAPRGELSPFAPRITSLKISPDSIKDLIGPGGKVIKELCETTGAKIEIEKDGRVNVFALNNDVFANVSARIRSITQTPEVGDEYDGEVVKIMDFGAFVNFSGSQDGLVHISEIAPRRLEKVTDALQLGDRVRVKVIGFDPKGRVRLSIRQALRDDES